MPDGPQQEWDLGLQGLFRVLHTSLQRLATQRVCEALLAFVIGHASTNRTGYASTDRTYHWVSAKAYVRTGLRESIQRVELDKRRLWISGELRSICPNRNGRRRKVYT